MSYQLILDFFQFIGRIIPRILIIGASLVKTKMFTFLMTENFCVICSQNLITIMIDCPIQHLVSTAETQLAFTSKSDLCQCTFFNLLSFIQRGKSLVVFQLFIEKLNGEAKHTFFRRIMKTSHHAGVESIIIKNIKNQVERYRKVVHKTVRCLKVMNHMLLMLLQVTGFSPTLNHWC